MMNAAACLAATNPLQGATPVTGEQLPQQSDAEAFAAMLMEAGAVGEVTPGTLALPEASASFELIAEPESIAVTGQLAETKRPEEAELPEEMATLLAGLFNPVQVLPAAQSEPVVPSVDEAAQSVSMAASPPQTSLRGTAAGPESGTAPVQSAPVQAAIEPPTAVPEVPAEALRDLAGEISAEPQVASTLRQNDGGAKPAQPKPAPSVEARDADRMGVKTLLASLSAAPAGSDAAANRGQAIVSSLIDRVPPPSTVVEGETRTTTGVELYASTREVVAGSSGTATGQQEVLRSPVGSPRWAHELGAKLMVMNLKGQQEGSLTLTPEHLGPMEVRINVTQDTASIWFGAQNAETRAALTEALPRLREMFAASGLALGHAGVSQEAPRQESRPTELRGGIGRVGSAEASESTTPLPEVRRVRAGALDAWA